MLEHDPAVVTKLNALDESSNVKSESLVNATSTYSMVIDDGVVDWKYNKNLRGAGPDGAMVKFLTPVDEYDDGPPVIPICGVTDIVPVRVVIFISQSYDDAIKLVLKLVTVMFAEHAVVDVTVNPDVDAENVHDPKPTENDHPFGNNIPNTLTDCWKSPLNNPNWPLMLLHPDANPIW